MLLKNVYLCLLLEGKANEEVYEKDRIVVDCRDDDFTGDGSGFFAAYVPEALILR